MSGRRRGFERPPRALAVAFGLNLVWINVAEVFRYFVFVMPMMRDALPTVPDVAPMSVPVFLVWGLWDTILVAVATLIPWLVFERFGVAKSTILSAGSGAWAAVFVLLWLALFNMNLATPAVIAVALPLAWLEMVVAACIVAWALTRNSGAGSRAG